MINMETHLSIFPDLISSGKINLSISETVEIIFPVTRTSQKKYEHSTCSFVFTIKNKLLTITIV